MNIADDDDLPVLTQVLRTGHRALPTSAPDETHERTSSGASTDLRADAFADPDGDLSWPRALVIGSDPEPHHDDRSGEARDRSSAHNPTARDGDHKDASAGPNRAPADSLMAGTDPRRIDLRDNDVFLRTAPIEDAFAGRFDEPPLVAGRDGHHAGGGRDAASSGTVSRDVPLVFGDRPSLATRDHDATFALQVRDSVLQQLSARIDTELDARIAQTLHAGLETALAHLQTSLRDDLAEALRDVVGRAVDDAIARLRNASPSDDTA